VTSARSWATVTGGSVATKARAATMWPACSARCAFRRAVHRDSSRRQSPRARRQCRPAVQRAANGPHCRSSYGHYREGGKLQGVHPPTPLVGDCPGPDAGKRMLRLPDQFTLGCRREDGTAIAPGERRLSRCRVR
jgi:hypothetical protein